MRGEASATSWTVSTRSGPWSASEAVGDGRFFVNAAVRYANERVVFDRPIGRNQGIQFPLARAHAELEAADMMARRAAALFDDGQACGSDANLAKLLASEACWRAAEAAVQTFAVSPSHGSTILSANGVSVAFIRWHLCQPT